MKKANFGPDKLLKEKTKEIREIVINSIINLLVGGGFRSANKWAEKVLEVMTKVAIKVLRSNLESFTLLD